MLLKIIGCEFDTAFGNFFAAVPPVGEMYVERDTNVRGRWWIDYLRDGQTLELFIGRTHVVLCRYHTPTSGRDGLTSA